MHVSRTWNMRFRRRREGWITLDVHRILLAVRFWLATFGLDPRTFIMGLRGLPAACRDYLKLRNEIRATGHAWKTRFSRPCLTDRYQSSGPAAGHYFQQDLLVASRILARRPTRHIDVGSRVDGFVSHVAVFRKLEVIDMRPLSVSHPNIIFRQCDLRHLPDDLIASCDSVSCLHALEHFGLGRYGDAVDADGHAHGLSNLVRMLTPGGTLYLSVPIGAQRIEFNAHRVFRVETILAIATDECELRDFSFVDNAGRLHESITPGWEVRLNVSRIDYGCGIFEFQKKGERA